MQRRKVAATAAFVGPLAGIAYLSSRKVENGAVFDSQDGAFAFAFVELNARGQSAFLPLKDANHVVELASKSEHEPWHSKSVTTAVNMRGMWQLSVFSPPKERTLCVNVDPAGPFGFQHGRRAKVTSLGFTSDQVYDQFISAFFQTIDTASADVSNLALMLDLDDPRIQVYVLGQLADLGPKAKRVSSRIEELLSSPRLETRIEAACTLFRIGVFGDLAERVFLESLESAPDSGKVYALWSIKDNGVFSEKIFLAISGLVIDENWRIRERATEALTGMEKGIAPPLSMISKLTEGKDGIRSASLRSLLSMTMDSDLLLQLALLQVLQRGLASTEPSSVLATVKYLESNPELIRPCIEQIRSLAANEPAPGVWMDGGLSFLAIGLMIRNDPNDPMVVPFLERILLSVSIYNRQAAERLGQLGSKAKQALPALRSRVAVRWVQDVAQEAIRRIEND